MQLYYIEKPSLPLPCPTQLSAEESVHVIKVLRKKVGDILFLTDGNGNLYEGIILGAHIKECSIMLQSCTPNYGKSTCNLHIAVAPTKNMDRFEWFLEKATEIGIQEITPLICEHSERTVIRTDRLQKIILSAAKQSLKTYLPVLHEPVKFDKFMLNKWTCTKFVAYVEEKQDVLLKNIYTKGQNALILIGPEGDFSKNEIELAKTNEYGIVSLGNARLRTETAAVVACHTINLIND